MVFTGTLGGMWVFKWYTARIVVSDLLTGKMFCFFFKLVYWEDGVLNWYTGRKAAFSLWYWEDDF